MRQFLGTAFFAVFCLVSVSFVRADDPGAAATLEKAIKAMGGEEKLAKAEAFSWKSNVRLIVNGSENEFNSQVTVKGLDQLRRELGNDQFKMILVVNGDRGWRKRGDENTELDAAGLTNEKRSIYLQVVPLRLVPLKSKGFKYQAATDEKVGDKPASGLKVTGPDGKDFTLYFDKDSGLPVREVARMADPQGNEITVDVTFADYKDFNGIKKATKMEVKRDGNVVQVVELTEFKVLDKVAPETFAEPK